MQNPLRRELKNEDDVVKKRLKSFIESHDERHLFLACHAVFPMALTTALIYSIWSNFQFDCKGHPLNIPWIAVSDILLSGLFEEGGNDLYQVDSAVRDELISQLELDPRFGPKRVRELAQFLLAYINHRPKSLDIDAQDLITAQWRTALVYLEPNVVVHELAPKLIQAYQCDESEVIRLESQIKTLSRPLQNANYESLLAYAWGMKELINADKASKFSGLIQLDRNPEDIRAEFRKLLCDEPLCSFLPEEEQLLPDNSRLILKVISKARQEAERFDHLFVNPEHLLLSILSQPDLLATKVLNHQGISFDRISRFLERAELANPPSISTRVREIFSFSDFKALPLSALSKRVLAFSRYVASQLDHKFINAEHLLLGILQDGENLASALLEKFAVNLEELQDQIISKIALNTYYAIPIIESEPGWSSYSQRAIKVLQSVRTLSPKWSYQTSNYPNYAKLGNGFISTEQILLELLEDKGIASIVATCADFTFEKAITEAQEKPKPALLLFEDENILPTRARKALSYAKEECLCLNHSKIDTYHLLLGCIREQDNAASTLLLHLKVNLPQLCTLLRNQATAEHHEKKSVIAIQVLSRLDIDPIAIRSNVKARLQTLDKLASDTIGNGVQVLNSLKVDLCEVRSQIIARFEAFDQFATDSNGKAGWILNDLGVDLYTARSQVISRLEVLEQFSIDRNGKTGEILENLGMNLSELRASLKLRMK